MLPHANRNRSVRARAPGTIRRTARCETASPFRRRSRSAGYTRPACTRRGARDGEPFWDSPRCRRRRSRTARGCRVADDAPAPESPRRSTRQLLRQVLDELRRRNTILLERIAIAHGHGLILRRLAVDRDAVGCAGFILTAVAAADRSAIVVEDVEVAPEGGMDAMGQLRHAVLVHQRKHGRLERSQRRLELQHHALVTASLRSLFATHLFFCIGVTQHYQRRAVRSRRRLDHVRNEPLVGLRIEIIELLPGMLLVIRQIEVGAVVDPLELLPAEREFILDVVRLPGVMCELVLVVLMPAQLVGTDAESFDPFHPLPAPEFEPLVLAAGLHEELHLHLLEFARPENKVAGRDLVAERLPDLRDAKGNLLPRGLQHVEIVDVDPLGGLGPQVDHRGLLLDRPDERLEHEIELTWRGEGPFAAAYGALGVRLARRAFDRGIVGPKSVLALLAVHERIGESRNMPRCLPDLGMHQDGRIEAFDIVAFVHHRSPPALLDVLLELDAERPVVPHGAEAAVDLGRLKHEAAPLGQRHELLHGFVCCSGGGGGGHREPEVTNPEPHARPARPFERGPDHPAYAPPRRHHPPRYARRSALRPCRRRRRPSSWRPGPAARPRRVLSPPARSCRRSLRP